MRKMLPGIILICLLLFVCIANSRFLSSRLNIIKSLAESDNIYECIEKWDEISGYANFVLRENKCDEIERLLAEAINKPDDNAVKTQLISQLEATIYMESISLSSIF